MKIHLFILVMLTPALASATLLHSYSFDEGVGTGTEDTTGNSDGTLNGASWTAGKYDDATSFDGVNDYVNLGNINLNGTSVTVTAWINSANLANCGAYHDCRIVSKATDSSEQGHYFMISTIANNGGTRLRFRLKTAGTTTTLIANNGPLTNDVWAHVAAVYDGSTMKLYKDGVEVASTTKTGTLTTAPAVPMWVGRNPGGYGPWHGAVDNVRIYNHALTSAEIVQDMNAAITAGPPDTTAPLVSITAPVNDALVAGTVSVSATATDDRSIAGVQFKVNGVNLGAEDTTAPYSVNWNTLGLTDDTAYTLSAIARDAAGNTQTASVTVTVDNLPPPDVTAPVVAITAPSNGATVSDVVGISATVTDNVAVVGVQFLLDGLLLLDDTSAPYSASWNTASTPNGAHTVRTVARDAAGNTATTEISVTVNNILPDTTPPIATVVTPTQNQLFTGDTISANLAITTDEIATCRWSNTNQAYTQMNAFDATSATSHSTVLEVTAGQSYTLYVRCQDVSGNVMNTSVSVAFSVAEQSTMLGLDFPGSAAVPDGETMRFKFDEPLEAYPATYIWRAYPRQQPSYYTAFFWANDDGAGNTGMLEYDPAFPNRITGYYGAHPYPINPPNGNTHQWEIAIDALDTVSEEEVEYDRWHTQAMVVRALPDGRKRHDYYWDLPNTSRVVTHIASMNYGELEPPFPALTWGDAPWAPGREVWNGVLSGIRVYETNLSMVDIQAEANAPLSTGAGASSIWYLNMNPTPTDISDQSGRGNDPAWVGPLRPTLYNSGPDVVAPTVLIDAPADNAVVADIITLSAVAIDDRGVLGVQFKVNGIALGPEVTSAPYTAAWDTTSATEDTAYAIAAVARDAAGNTQTATVTVTVDNLPPPDTIAPSISVSSPVSGSLVAGTITIRAVASDNTGIGGVQFLIDGANVGTEDVVAPYELQWNSGATSDGSHMFTGVARDAAGNTNSAAITLVVSNAGLVCAP